MKKEFFGGFVITSYSIHYTKLYDTALNVLGTTQIKYGDIEIDLSKPFERITMIDAVKKYSGVDFNEVGSLEAARSLRITSYNVCYTKLLRVFRLDIYGNSTTFEISFKLMEDLSSAVG